MSTGRKKSSFHPKDGREILAVATQEAFRRWLNRQCDKCEGIWLKFAKKGSGAASVTYAEALDVALCHAQDGTAPHALRQGRIASTDQNGG